jgi:two-component system, NarL family, nitrate/nitrite response regulator NarL
MHKILIADDHPIVLDGLASLFRDSAFEVVAKCETGEQVLQAFADAQPDVFLLDVHMPAPGGLEVARRLKESEGGCGVRIVLLTSSVDDDQLLEAIELRINGLVLKESAPRQLLRCLEAVLDGDQWFDPQLAHRAMTAWLHRGKPGGSEPRLSGRESQVARLVAAGLRNKEIGRELGLTEGTVKIYMHSIYQKLQVKSRVELVNVAREQNLLA